MRSCKGLERVIDTGGLFCMGCAVSRGNSLSDLQAVVGQPASHIGRLILFLLGYWLTTLAFALSFVFCIFNHGYHIHNRT